MSVEPTWNEISEVLVHLGQALNMEWQCGMAPEDSLPSPALDAEIDVWCERLAMHADDPLPAPEHVRPWILARLASFAVTAADLSRQGCTDAPEFSPSTLRHFLIDEWHGCLRERWGLRVMHSDLSNS